MSFISNLNIQKLKMIHFKIQKDLFIDLFIL